MLIEIDSIKNSVSVPTFSSAHSTVQQKPTINLSNSTNSLNESTSNKIK